MRRTVMACLSLVASVALLAGCGDDDPDESGDPVSTSSGATPSSPEADADSSSGGTVSPSPTAPPSELTTATATSSPSARSGSNAAFCTAVDAADDATDLAELRSVVAELVRTLPDEASADARAGLTYLSGIVKEASSFNDMGTRVSQGSAEEKRLAAAYGEFEDQACD